MYKFMIKLFNIKYVLKKRYKQYIFRKNSIIGDKTIIDYNANCKNLSNNKENIIIGDNCSLCGTLISNEKGKIKIGNNTTIRYSSKISCLERITIGNDVIISNNVNIYDHNSHPIDPITRRRMCQEGMESDLWDIKHAQSKEVIIEDNVWIGERATILKGVKISEGSIVAMGAMVTKDVPAFSIVAGNPARVVKYIYE